MTNEQFDALRDFIDNRILLITAMEERPRDRTFQDARTRELDEAEAQARAVLVEDEGDALAYPVADPWGDA